MSDVVVSTTASTTVVTTSSTAVNIAVNTYPVTVSASSVGLQGPTGANGATGATGATGDTGAQGSAGVGYAGITSTTSITIGTGLKTWTVSSVGAFVPGMRIRAINTNSTTNWVEGPANVASGTTIIITVDKTAGSGTFTTWTFAATGEIGAQGNTGAQGTAGASGVISVTAPITNTGSSSSAIIGLDQTQLTLTRSQISDFTSGTVAVATSATSANTALTAGTASYATTSGTSVYATNAGTSIGVSGSAITRSQISDFTSGTVAVATSATSASTATNAGTASYATTSGTAVYATTSGTATYATTSGTAVNISGTVTASQVSGLPAIYASLGSANLFTLGQVIQSGSAANTGLVVRGTASQTGNLQEWQNTGSTVIASVTSGGSFYSSANIGAGGTAISTARLSVLGAASGIGAIIRASLTTPGDLQQWQSSSSAVVASVSNTGGLTAASLTTAGTTTLSGSNAALITGGTAGTSGQVLTSAGAGASPTWTTVSGGGGTPVINATVNSPISGRNYTTYTADVVNLSSYTFTTGTMTAQPFMVGVSSTAVKIGYQVETGGAGGVARLGIYSNATSGGDYPANLILDAGTVATNTSGFKSITISQTLTAGTLYWLVISPQTQGISGNYGSGYFNVSPFAPGFGATPNISQAPSLGWSMTGVTGALPSTFSATKVGNATLPLIFIGF